MHDEHGPAPTASDLIVQRLVQEAGITDAQARELIVVLGVYNWASLLREARFLKGAGLSERW
ncbi:hypothetical protein NKH64_08065 [Mesorhizobium sp. M0999]|uniref:hypothetical protein n=1 Tax=unclassified Mesorhizobium TaxID=325217 RepID=UPI0003CDFA47|nr:hypothetical protein [Mesorhizobium sp. LSHC412B00]ESX85344.1 hypothetical protein X756_22670 [Mesorhizobium sp. LSHC412B00]